MTKINCEGCTNHCCGKNSFLTPVLLPSEEEKFKKYSRVIKTSYGNIRVLSKKKNGNCIFLDDKTIKCTIYGTRPIECRLYPFLLDFTREKPTVKLDERFCPNLQMLHFDMSKILNVIKKQQFPTDWIRAYKTLENY